MKKKNKNRLISLVLCFSILLTVKQSYTLYLKKHPKELYDLKKTDEIVSILNDEFVESCAIPSLGTFVPQGIAVNDDYIFISLYDSLKLSKSMFYVFDYDFKLQHKVSLDSYSHVGGISFDPTNNCIWSSGISGSVCAYSVEDVLTKKNIKPIYINKNIGKDLINYRGQKAVSFLTVFNNKLYVGNYTYINDGTIKIYDIVCEDGKVCLKYNSKFSVPTMVQGVSFYECDDDTYILFSRSCGNGVSSYVQMYKYCDDFNYEKLPSTTFELMPMLEQIHVDSDGDLKSVYESNACVYSNGRKKDDFKEFSLSKYIKKSEN